MYSVCVELNLCFLQELHYFVYTHTRRIFFLQRMVFTVELMNAIFKDDLDSVIDLVDKGIDIIHSQDGVWVMYILMNRMDGQH